MFSTATEQRVSQGDGTYSGDEGVAAWQIPNREADGERGIDRHDGWQAPSFFLT